MTRPSINRVAVIGAGISGVVTAAHLLSAGLEVTVFERNQEAGGVWLFDNRKPLEPTYPSTKPSEGERTGQYEDIDEPERTLLEHAPPGPCYVGLHNNVITPLLQTTLTPWPEQTPDIVPHQVLNEYIQTTSRETGVHDITVYGAKVVNVTQKKPGAKWLVSWTILDKDAGTGTLRVLDEEALFDAVVVASGHYHAPRIPDIPGLADIKRLWPSRVVHSKSYRKPEDYYGKNVLLIGGGVSSTDIARELGPLANAIYQSTRDGLFDLVESLLPDNGVRVAEIASFELPSPASPEKNLEEGHHLPVTVHLKSHNSTDLVDIDYIIICTGYHFTLPFLQEYHEDDSNPANASDTVLITDGTQIHNLHKDIFYIPAPTLAFIGVPFYTATFTLFEFQAIALAAVFSGIAQLPSESNMREEYGARVEQKGVGRSFNSLRGEEEVYVKELLDWINFFRSRCGLPTIQGYTETWVKAREQQKARVEKLLAMKR